MPHNPISPEWLDGVISLTVVAKGTEGTKGDERDDEEAKNMRARCAGLTE